MNSKETKKFIGVDLHKNRFTAHYIEPNDRYSMTFELPEIDKFLGTVNANDTLAFEASCNTFTFYDLVMKRSTDLTVFNPYKLKLISQVQKKTDKVDAEKLAQFVKIFRLGGEEIIDPVYVPQQNIRNLRSLFATYKNFKRHIVMWKNRIHALLSQHMILINICDMNSTIGRKRILEKAGEYPMVKTQIEILFSQLETTEAGQEKIENLIYTAGRGFLDIIDILTSITGISVFTALAIIADVGDISRFKNPKKLATYLRSAPGIDSSNETTIIKKTNKYGRRLSIELLIQSVNHFSVGNKKPCFFLLIISSGNKSAITRLKRILS